MNRLRAVGAVEAAAGSLVLARAGLVLRAVNGVPPTAAVVAIARVLGARMLAQGAVAALVPSRRIGLGGAATDVAHAASMVPVVRWSVAYRRTALVSAAAAVAFAAGQALATRAEEPQP